VLSWRPILFIPCLFVVLVRCAKPIGNRQSGSRAAVRLERSWRPIVFIPWLSVVLVRCATPIGNSQSCSRAANAVGAVSLAHSAYPLTLCCACQAPPSRVETTGSWRPPRFKPLQVGSPISASSSFVPCSMRPLFQAIAGWESYQRFILICSLFVATPEVRGPSRPYKVTESCSGAAVQPCSRAVVQSTPVRSCRLSALSYHRFILICALFAATPVSSHCRLGVLSAPHPHFFSGRGDPPPSFKPLEVHGPSTPYRVTESCRAAAVQPCSRAVVQSCSRAVVQPCSRPLCGHAACRRCPLSASSSFVLCWRRPLFQAIGGARSLHALQRDGELQWCSRAVMQSCRLSGVL
jgi:hypothetical protein